jgi:hypothetical protein
VRFPLYEPAVTLGFKRSLDGPIPCGYGGIETVDSVYRKGSGNRAPSFSFTESFPRICGNAGESRTVGTVDINGVSVDLGVYCGPEPKCNETISNGFKNGFLLFLRQPGPTRTWVQTSSRYVALEDFLKTVRSLTRVRPTPGAGSSRGAFRSPSGNLSCDMGDSLLLCQSLRPPITAWMPASQQYEVCKGTGCALNRSQNAPVLAYGKRVMAGSFRCLSQEGGVTCSSMRSGKGFLLNRNGVTPVR